MKTIGQAIDEITRDRSKEFRSEELIMFWDFPSCQIAIRNTEINGMVLRTVLITKHLGLEWELIQKPVTFMEVVESKKLFKIDHPSFSPCYTNSYFNLGTFFDELVNEFSMETMRAILTDGKFYIKEYN